MDAPVDQDGNSLQLRTVLRISSHNTSSQISVEFSCGGGYVSKIEGDNKVWLE